MSAFFDESYCNQLLDEMARSFHRSNYGPQHMKKEPSPYAARILSKKFIQLAQINIALTQVIQSPHLEECFQNLSVLQTPYLEEDSFLNEMHSFFTSEYGEDDARNYAIALKQYIELVQFAVVDLMKLKQVIFDTNVEEWKVKEVDAFRRNTQRKIKAFLSAKETHFMEAFHRLEVYREKQRFHKMVAILESE
jgi:hypothetical protein